MSKKKLLGYRCNNCGKRIYPKHAVCSKCKNREFSEFEIDEIGTIITYTKLYAVPEGVDIKPLTLGVIEFNEGVKVTGQLINEDVKIGDKVRPVWGKLRKSEGKDIYGFKFEIARA